jgi:deoxyribose-phosphate aldolase
MEHITAHDIAQMIDHSLLNPKLTRQETEDGCRLALAYNCASVCVKPCDVTTAVEILRGSNVLVTTVIGFPHGSNLTEVKVFEAERAINQGCVEIDMVQNIGRLLSGDYSLVEADIRAVVETAHRQNVIVKIIFENAYLTDEQKIKVCQFCATAGADYTKTATGYAPTGATIHDLKLMRSNTPPHMRVKAAGGVRQLSDALAVRAVGVSRFGCTTTAKMLDLAKDLEKKRELIVPDLDSVKELQYLINNT